MFDTRRITLVSRRPDAPPRAWDLSAEAANRIILVDVFSLLKYALDHVSQDVDRVLVDGAATAAEFLDLLITLPSDFLGDVMLIRDDDSCFLSSAGRGGGRLLYAMTAVDLKFYLETLGLVQARVGSRDSGVEVCSFLSSTPRPPAPDPRPPCYL